MKWVVIYGVLIGSFLVQGQLCAAKHWPAPKTTEEIAAHRKYVVSLLNNPYVRAFGDMTASCEGTYVPGGYRMLFQKDRSLKPTLFDSFADHPRIRICTKLNGSPLCTTAAGRYQFIERTWDDVAWKIGAEDFSPLNQDAGFVQLLIENGAVEDLLAGEFERALKKTKNVWASFPDAPYGQPTRNFAYAEKIFKERLAHYQGLQNKRPGSLRKTS